jgi:hypothetical protein
MDHSEAEKVVSIRELEFEEGAEELTDSAMMEPYVRLAEAVITHEGIREAIAEIAGLPLEQRYLWRVLSALKWGFADSIMSTSPLIARRSGPKTGRRLST